MAPEEQLVVSVDPQQVLGVGVESPEFPDGKPFAKHAVNGVTAAATYAKDADVKRLALLRRTKVGLNP